MSSWEVRAGHPCNCAVVKVRHVPAASIVCTANHHKSCLLAQLRSAYQCPNLELMRMVQAWPTAGRVPPCVSACIRVHYSVQSMAGAALRAGVMQATLLQGGALQRQLEALRDPRLPCTDNWQLQQQSSAPSIHPAHAHVGEQSPRVKLLRAPADSVAACRLRSSRWARCRGSWTRCGTLAYPETPSCASWAWQPSAAPCSSRWTRSLWRLRRSKSRQAFLLSDDPFPCKKVPVIRYWSWSCLPRCATLQQQRPP